MFLIWYVKHYVQNEHIAVIHRLVRPAFLDDLLTLTVPIDLHFMAHLRACAEPRDLRLFLLLIYVLVDTINVMALLIFTKMGKIVVNTIDWVSGVTKIAISHHLLSAGAHVRISRELTHNLQINTRFCTLSGQAAAPYIVPFVDLMHANLYFVFRQVACWKVSNKSWK